MGKILKIFSKMHTFTAVAVMICLFATGLLYAEEVSPHNGTLFGYEDELAAVPRGTLAEIGGAVYADAELFYGIFGYKHRYYHDSKMLLVWNYNHKILYIGGQQLFREVESVFVKGDAQRSKQQSQEQPQQGLGEDKTLTAAAVFRGGRMYIPLSDVLKTLNLEYDFENYGIIYLPNRELLAALPGYHTTKSEVLNFARIIYYETRDGSLYKKIAVAGVIMNRVNSDRFPNTVNDVIFAKNQFPPAYYTGFATLEPAQIHFEGAVRGINGENNAPGCFFFNYLPFYGKEADFYKIIEGDYFYR